MNKIKFPQLLSLLAVIAGITFCAIWAFHAITGSTAYSTTWDSKRDTEEIKAACRHHVRSADSKAAAAIDQRSQTFAAFIESGKAGATPFSTAIVSFYGKWRAVKSYLPFVPKDDHRQYVEELFAIHIFQVSDIAAAMRQAIEGSIKDLDGIENELAVALRQEILGRSLAPDEIPIAAENFKRAIEQMMKASKFDAEKTVGSLIVSEVAAQLTTQVILRLGVSAGILATGAANSWWSLGGGLAAGLIADMVWVWFDDPRGDIERELLAALDRLAARAASSIHAEMIAIISKRRTLWSKTIDTIEP
jgi:hypothetical protein